MRPAVEAGRQTRKRSAVEDHMLELEQHKKALAPGIYEAGGNAAAALEAIDIERPFEPLG